MGGFTGRWPNPTLVLGLYGDDGQLHSFGLGQVLKAHSLGPLASAAPRGRPAERPVNNRWSSHSVGDWTELPEALVAEVAVNRIDRGKLRYSARFIRWRQDRDPQSCTTEQLASGLGQPNVGLAAISWLKLTVLDWLHRWHSGMAGEPPTGVATTRSVQGDVSRP